MAQPGDYRDVKNELVISDDGSNTATLIVRSMAPMGHYADYYNLSHDNGFPVTVLNTVGEVTRKHYRGPSEASCRSSSECPKKFVCDVFQFFPSRNMTGKFVLKKGLQPDAEEILLKLMPVLPLPPDGWKSGMKEESKKESKGEDEPENVDDE